jgi:hypothetical protein
MDRTQSPIQSEQTTTRVFTVDPEHGRLRLVVVIVFAISAVAGFLAIDALTPSAGLNILALIGGFVVAYGVTALFERLLKERWPSGRTVEVDASGVRMMQHGQVQQQITADGPTMTLLWRFQTKRRSRVPKGWYLLACALEQDDATVSVYTLMSPDQFKKLDNGERFKPLKAKADTADVTSRGRDDLLLAGEQRRLLQAENQRWQTGGELSVEDFSAYLDTVSARFPNWIRSE